MQSVAANLVSAVHDSLADARKKIRPGDDPVFYDVKAALRRRYPQAHMIEIAGSVITVVSDEGTLMVGA